MSSLRNLFFNNLVERGLGLVSLRDWDGKDEILLPIPTLENPKEGEVLYDANNWPTIKIIKAELCPIDKTAVANFIRGDQK